MPVNPSTSFDLATSTFTTDLHAWYRDNQRKLPWRTQPSLYKTVLSEFMLQQTQVTTVLPYYKRWLSAFPDFKALAAASEATVLKQWEGLGYYSRARNLHKLAKAYSQAKPKPITSQAWLRFPGIGPYTSAAIASIAHGESVAVVDGNVIRILTRLTADDTAFKDSSTASRSLLPLASRIISTTDDPGNHNQAMMELGATVCMRKKPQCLLCPVQQHCAAYRTGNVEGYPNLKRRAIVQRQVDRVFALRNGFVLLHQTPSHAKRLANVCELPEASGLQLTNKDLGELIIRKKRGISNEHITEHIYHYQPNLAALKQIKQQVAYFWADTNKLDKYTLSGPHKKWLQELLMKDAKSQ